MKECYGGKQKSENNILKMFFGFSMASWVSAGIGFLLTPIITRTIYPAELGKIDMFVTYCNMFIYASTLGMHQGYMRFFNDLPKGFTKEKLLSFAVKIASLGALGAGIVCIIGYKFFSIAILNKSTFIIAVLMASYIFSYVFLDVIKTRPRMYGDTVQYTIIVVSMSIGAKIGYLSFAMSNNVLSTIIVITGINVVLMLVYLLKNRRSIFIVKGQVEKESYSIILRYALPTVPVMFISNVNTSLPKMLLNKYCNSTTIGIYAGALTIVQIISLLQVGITTFWAPYVFKNYKTKKLEIQKVHLIITFGMVLFGLLLILCQDILFLILGSSYRSSKVFYAILLASPIFYTIGETVGIGIGIEKKTYWNIITTGGAFVCNMLLGMILVPRYANIGAAISVMVSAGVMLLLKACLGERYYKVITSPLKTWGAIGIYVIAAIVSMLCSEYELLRCCIILGLIIVLFVIYLKEIVECVLYVKKAVHYLLRKEIEETNR